LARIDIASLVFLSTLAVTFGAAFFARMRASQNGPDEELAGRRLNRWLIGLSAGTTGNSGFVVTGAVGLGYVGGAHWLMLAISWLVGDLVYWSIFPARLNRVARESRAITLSDMLTSNLNGKAAQAISFLVAAILVAFLSTYTAAQWLAGKKFLSGMFSFSDYTALLLFAGTIILYSTLGGFRGSIYTDFVQAIIRIVGTAIALAAVSWYAIADSDSFYRNIASAGPGFFELFPDSTTTSILGFILGYAAAAVGFGLGQPQIVSRYMAGSSPEETKRAMWIYIFFLQFTWLAMTAFGMILRGVMPGIADPEAGLSLFFRQNITPVVTGIIFADVFATIASTSNGILVVMAQTFVRNILPIGKKSAASEKIKITAVTFALGLVTIGLSMLLPGNVFSIAIDSVSEIAAGLAGAVMIKVLGWRHTAGSLLVAIIGGIGSALLWKALGYDAIFNEAGVGMLASITGSWIYSRWTSAQTA